VDIKVEVKDEAVVNLLNRLKSRARDLTPAMRVIGEIVRSSVLKNFMAGGRPDRWTPTKVLSTYLSYTMRKTGSGSRRKAYTLRGGLTKGFERYAAGKKTLIDTGRLKNSITARAYSGRAVVGTNVIYAAIHQFGGMAGRGRKVRIPARPFLMVQDEDWPAIRQSLERHLFGGSER